MKILVDCEPMINFNTFAYTIRKLENSTLKILILQNVTEKYLTFFGRLGMNRMSVRLLSAASNVPPDNAGCENTIKPISSR